jgi:DNA-binding response OmpR family regulator
MRAPEAKAEGGILLVEADPEWRRLLADALVASGHEVWDAGDILTAARLARVRQPDLMVLGTTREGLGHVEACWELRSAAGAPILLVKRWGESWGDHLVLQIDGSHQGVSLLSFPQLVARLDETLQAQSAVPEPPDPPVQTVGQLHIDRISRQAYVAGSPLHLAAREFDLLSFLLAHPGRVFSAQALLTNVWGPEVAVRDLKTVAVHIRWLRVKLAGQADVTITTVRGAGYRLDLLTGGGKA